jgi:hypothetical protein
LAIHAAAAAAMYWNDARNQFPFIYWEQRRGWPESTRPISHCVCMCVCLFFYLTADSSSSSGRASAGSSRHKRGGGRNKSASIARWMLIEHQKPSCVHALTIWVYVIIIITITRFVYDVASPTYIDSETLSPRRVHVCWPLYMSKGNQCRESFKRARWRVRCQLMW